MDRRTRPEFTRCRFACALAVALCTIAATGCGGSSYVNYSSGSTGSTGTSTGTGFTAYANSPSSGYIVLGMITLLGIHSELWNDSIRRYGHFPVPAPPMDPARGVNLQDCTKPIENSSANLQCK